MMTSLCIKCLENLNLACWGSGRGTPKSDRDKAPGDDTHGPDFRRKSRSSSDDRVGRGDNTWGCEGHGLPESLHTVKATCEEQKRRKWQQRRKQGPEHRHLVLS